jgi:predicted secreted hydrolase
VRFANNRFASANGPGCYSLACGSEGLSLDLSLKAEKAPLLVNQVGLIREGLLGTSWYYSLTSMRVEGQLVVAGDAKHVSGIGWIDRQWGRWEDMGIGGWEWFSLQLSNGCEVLVTQIYSPVTGRTCSKILSMKRRDSSEYHSMNFAVRRIESLTGSLSGSKYGKKWLIEAPGVLRLVVEVDFEDQEFHKGLWEGCCNAQGVLEGGEVTGLGYAEQVDRGQGPLSERLSLAAAPGHFVLQNLLGRANLGLWDLSERLKLWRILSLRRGAT